MGGEERKCWQAFFLHTYEFGPGSLRDVPAPSWSNRKDGMVMERAYAISCLVFNVHECDDVPVITELVAIRISDEISISPRFQKLVVSEAR